MEERECSGGFARSPLQRAAADGDLARVRHLLECTTVFGNLDAIDENGCTALMIAAKGGHTALVRVLIDAGADLDAIDANGQDAAATADAAGHSAVAKMLRTEAGSRAELWAAISGEPKKSSSTSSTAAPRAAPDDLMAKLLADAGLPKGPAESPF